MFNLNVRIVAALLAAGLGVSATPATAAILGPHADACAPGAARAAMLVKVERLRSRAGKVRVQSYGGDPAGYFEKGTYLERVDVQPPASGPVEVCMTVPRSGTYAISVKHDLGGGGLSLQDGGGFSGNPSVSPMDVLFKRKPSPRQVEVAVRGLTVVPVEMNYLQGGR